MRVKQFGISVHAIPGTHSVMFGLDADEAARPGLLGFALGRRWSGGIDWMDGFKFFRETLPDPAPGTLKPTTDHPVQDFQWSDYNARPGAVTDYVIRPLYGVPQALTHPGDIDLRVGTLNDAVSTHKVHFNMGAVPGQAFARRFGNTYPTEAEQDDPENAKVKWLSRGLLEAALAFIARASGPGFELRVGAYEFAYRPILNALRQAALRGATVRVSVHMGYRRQNGSIYQDETSLRNWESLLEAGPDKTPALAAMERKGLTLHPRTRFGNIPHNKFIVLLQNGNPAAVWTGSTNFTPSGFLGQSNLAHEIEDPALAAQYSRYWEALVADAPAADMRLALAAMTPDPLGLAAGVQPVLSPRPRGMLELYRDRMQAADQAGFLTAAFGVSAVMADAFTGASNTLRMVLAENAGRSASARAIMDRIEADRDNIVAMGNYLSARALETQGDMPLDRWFLREERHRKTGNIFFIHTKFMLVDPFGDAFLASGSANFSDASVFENDENMLLMVGDAAKAVAPIFVNEFMRLHRHLYFRTVAQRGTGAPEDVVWLKPDDSWQSAHFTPGRQKHRKRLLFR
jgi:phosphatidylserine/phosphatidylglycerophosphate/cardiolipin synthase-like enzyme